jgi:hypothetical protein
LFQRAWLIAALLLPGAARAATPDIWLLEDVRGERQWCGFHDRAAFLKASHESGSAIFGGLYYRDGRLTGIEESADIGDHLLYQSYTLDKDGALKTFQRRSEMDKFDAIVVEDYERHDGKWSLVRTAFLDRDGKPLEAPRDVQWPEGPPIHDMLSQFPFSPLFDNPALRIADKVCTRATQ